jgi:hypothetical protein
VREWRGERGAGSGLVERVERLPPPCARSASRALCWNSDLPNEVLVGPPTLVGPTSSAVVFTRSRTYLCGLPLAGRRERRPRSSQSRPAPRADGGQIAVSAKPKAGRQPPPGVNFNFNFNFNASAAPLGRAEHKIRIRSGSDITQRT